jgi:hypothetical protein
VSAGACASINQCCLRTLRREGLGLAGVVAGVPAAGAVVWAPHCWLQPEVAVVLVVVVAEVFESLIILLLSVQLVAFQQPTFLYRSRRASHHSAASRPHEMAVFID